MKKFNPQTIEKKWLKKWEKKPHFAEASRGKKFYALVEFPYPSGQGLHMGHAFTYPIMDVLARKKRMDGFNVLQPMGWDAFGLPTENYALKTGIHPTIVTKRNTDRFRQQMKRLALAYDWDREVNTTDPDYYQWTQWIFIQLFKHGLAYKHQMPINWCPSCKIGLANEEVVAGKCERCGAPASRKELSQWLLRITLYADRLANELDLVDYPHYVKAAQRNWIGKSEGLEEQWQVEGMDLKLKTFTTWPHTTWGATFMVIAPEHPVIEQLVKGTKYEKEAKVFCEKAIRDKIKDSLNVEKNKEGFFLGRYVINHLSGRKMPLYIANFAIYEYGTGIVKCTPTHDQRDFEFAKKYNLDFVPVIYPKEGQPQDPEKMKEPYTGEGLMMNAGQFNDMPTEKARKAIGDYAVKQGNGRWTVNYKLRDWIFSRQHYWGEPIPMIHCPDCAEKGITWWDTKSGNKFKPLFKPKSNLMGWFPLSDDQLPLELPKIKKYEPSGTGESPLAAIRNWVKTECPQCGSPVYRETDTMPNWAGSSWYFLRYCDPKNNKSLADPRKMKYWLPVDIYLGGAEHTTLHLLYSRFWHKFLNDINVVPGKEPYQARRQHGVILGEDGFRMSKSRGNIINPEKMMEKYGVDALRLYLMFMGPYDQTMPWNTKGIEGCYRFLKKVWRLYYQPEKIGDKGDKVLIRQLHQLIKKVSEDIEGLDHNTAIAAMMEFINSWIKLGQLFQKDAGIFLMLLAPYAPYVAEELWQEVLKKKISIHRQKWPKYDPRLAKEEVVTIVVQVNGKLRDKLEVATSGVKQKKEIEKLAKSSEKAQKYLKNKEIKKVIFVPGRLINFVI